MSNESGRVKGTELGGQTGRFLMSSGDANLYYYRARYYDTVPGRFLSEDPIGIISSLNFYAYVHNRPTGYTDPWGWIDVDISGSGPRGSPVFGIGIVELPV